MAKPESKYSEDVHLHLTFIQGIITRMNSNSFSMKSWMVAIVSALGAIYASNTCNPHSYVYFFIAVAAVLIFWCLDAYYLKMERQYRDLYNDVLKRTEETDFNLEADDYKQSFWCALWSKSNWPLYLPFFLVLLGAALYLVLK